MKNRSLQNCAIGFAAVFFSLRGGTGGGGEICFQFLLIICSIIRFRCKNLFFFHLIKLLAKQRKEEVQVAKNDEGRRSDSTETMKDAKNRRSKKIEEKQTNKKKKSGI